MIFYTIHFSAPSFRAGYIRGSKHDGCIALLPNSHNGPQRFAGDPYTLMRFALGGGRFIQITVPLKIFTFTVPYLSQMGIVSWQSVHLDTVATEAAPVRAQTFRRRKAAEKKKNPVNWILLFYNSIFYQS